MAVTVDSTSVNSSSTLTLTTSSGANRIIAGRNVSGSVHTTTLSGGQTPDFSLYNSFVWTLNGNLTLNNPSDEATGMSGVFVFIHSGAGRTVSLGTDYETVGGSGLSLSGSSGATDIVAYYVASSGRIILGAPQLNVS